MFCKLLTDNGTITGEKNTFALVSGGELRDA
jgi:hypothetical protein